MTTNEIISLVEERHIYKNIAKALNNLSTYLIVKGHKLNSPEFVKANRLCDYYTSKQLKIETKLKRIKNKREVFN